MKSVGEVMAIGRTFAESLQKGLRSLETGLSGLDEIEIDGLGLGDDKNALRAALGRPTPDRLLVVAQALRHGLTPEEINAACRFDPWFIARIQEIVELEAKVRAFGLPQDAANLRMLKAAGFSDMRLAVLAGLTETAVTQLRHSLGVRPVFKRIDTCAAEFASPTAYMYSTYEAPFAGEARLRGSPHVARQGRHIGRRTEPDRPGHRIRLLLLSCLFRFARSRLRNHHDQLQSGNRLDRL